MDPVDIVYDEGDDVTFTCSSLGGPGNTLQWLKDGLDLNGSTSEILTLVSITVIDDGGVYTCVASNAAGSDNASVRLNIRPVFIIHPMNQSIVNGTDISFNCSAMGFPEPVYTWFREDDDLPQSAMVVNSSILVFEPAVFGDQGIYYCNATSSDVSVSSETAILTSQSFIIGFVCISYNHNLCLIVSPQDGVSITPDNATFNENDTVILQCITYGGPGNTFEWIFNETVIENTSNLTLTGVMAEDGGDYICIVSNEAGSNNATAVLSVSLYVSGPQIGINTTNGTMEIITCMIEGFPINYTWEKMDNGSYSEVSIGRDLVFDPVIFGDEGVYRCVARSDVSDDLISDAVTVTSE